jgi:Right handed beta helix region
LNGTTVFTVASGVTATFRNLTIRNGTSDLSFPDGGGGIRNEGTLTVTNSEFSNNGAVGFFGVGGGIENGGTLTITNSTFSGNGAFEGGAIYNTGTLTIANSTFSGSAHIAGGIYNTGTLTVANSTFSANGAAEDCGGIANDDGTLSVTNSTFTDNFAGLGDGGGILNFNDGTLSVTNSTFSGNKAIDGGGIENEGTMTVTNSTFFTNSTISGLGGGGGIENEGTMTVTNSTFSANSTPFLNGGGGAIENFGTASLKNTILAGSGPSDNCSVFKTTISDAGYNISDDATCGFSATGSRNSTNPILDPAGLGNNGGPTATIALDSESPAIDAIPLADCTDQNSNPIHTDQRGALRPDPGEVVCDIGAYEFQDFAGQAKCERKSDSALVQQYGSLSAAASAYGFSTVKALEAVIQRSCERTPVVICPPSGKGIEAPCVVHMVK